MPSTELQVKFVKLILYVPELPSPSFIDVGDRSITLTFEAPPPALAGDLDRNITQYAVTLTPQDGGDPITVFVPAEAGSEVTVSGLEPETIYDVKIEAVIDTAGQGEETYDVGFTPMSVETSKFNTHVTGQESLIAHSERL